MITTWLIEHVDWILGTVGTALMAWIGRRRGWWGTLAELKNLKLAYEEEKGKNEICESKYQYVKRAYSELVEAAELAKDADRRRWDVTKVRRSEESQTGSPTGNDRT